MWFQLTLSELGYRELKMLVEILINLFFLKLLPAQFDGSFWWMNKKLNEYRTEPAPPQFEELSEFDTDESAKIIFKDKDSFSYSDLLINDNVREGKSYNDEAKLDVHFQAQSSIAWPGDIKESNSLIQEDSRNSTEEPKRNETIKKGEDILDFRFPDDKEFWHIIHGDESTTTSSTTEKSINNTRNNVNTVILIKDKTPIKVQQRPLILSETEHICTSLKKVECTQRGGVVYVKTDRVSQKQSSELQTICCILPISEKSETKIHFIEPSRQNKRIKRSNPETAAMKQRNALLLRKFRLQKQQALKRKQISEKQGEKIVAAADEDPYWNIKNSNFKYPSDVPSYQSTSKYDYSSDDYEEDYVIEVPQPGGLVGLYSDNPTKPPSWSLVGEHPGSPYGGFIDSEEDGGTSFVYPATVDPRLDNRFGASKPPIRGRPVKLSVASNEKLYDAESQTISYQSNPNFQVMQGYKLLNLVCNKSRIYRNQRKTTTERVFDYDSKESVLTGLGNEDDFDRNEQINMNCGKPAHVTDYDDDETRKQNGNSEIGDHPWLAMIASTRKLENILCYATIVSPKAAVTAADCVHGRTSPGDVTLIAGIWDLGDVTHEGWQKRLVTAHLHPHYRPGDLANDLAILHWKRPLRLTKTVQPACLLDPYVGDDCKFFGWGGYDQVMQPRSSWQRATLMTPRACKEIISPRKRTDIPKEAFCASVNSKGTVTGIGGPLICRVDGRDSVVGVAVWRDQVVILIPAMDWTTQTIESLQLADKK